MFHNRSFKTFAVFVMVTVMVAGISYLFSNTITSAEAAAPSCGEFTNNAARLSASEVYYAQRFMPPESCSTRPVQDVSASGLCVQQAFAVEGASRNLSPSELYYALKAQRFMSCKVTDWITVLPQ